MHIHLHEFVKRGRLCMYESDCLRNVEDNLEPLVPVKGCVAEFPSTLMKKQKIFLFMELSATKTRKLQMILQPLQAFSTP